MKKIYILVIAVLLFNFTATAQTPVIEDDFDFYTLGPMGNQAPWWTTWSGVTGTAEDIQVVNDNSNSGDQSGFIGPGGVTPDALLLLGNQTAGQYTVIFYMYVPAANVAYWNIQEDETPGIQWNAEFWVGATASGGTTGFITHNDTGNTVPYPSDQWFEIRHEIDLDLFTLSVTVDGATFLDNVPYPGTKLGAIDFFSIDANNTYWIDDILYYDQFLGQDDFNQALFTVYPNPVKDVLNISTTEAVDAITVYDVLGKVVLQVTPDAISPSINMSALSSGAYLVQVTIGNATKTVKVIK